MALDRLHGALGLGFPSCRRWSAASHQQHRLALPVPSPRPSIAAADGETLVGLLWCASRSQVKAGRVDAVVEVARASIAVRRVERALSGELRALARQVFCPNRKIAELDATIAAEFAKLGHRPADFPGGGLVGLATILAQAGPAVPVPLRLMPGRHAEHQVYTHPALSKACNR